MLAAAALLAAASTISAITPPNGSLTTVPVGYFGGNYAHRGEKNIEMLAKMRIVMLEKWEGACWNDCLANPGSDACSSGCGVENYILDTHRRIKAINPAVSCVLYLNTLFDFPFYSLHGVANSTPGGDTIDSSTGVPMVLTNDNGMKNIYIWGFDSDAGVQLYVDAHRNLTSLGVDGFFGDKWSKKAQPNKDGQWQICNHGCGNVTEEQGKRWNAGKLKALTEINKVVGDGPWFMNGNPFNGTLNSNFRGKWNKEPLLFAGDPRELIDYIQNEFVNHTYVYMASTGDQHPTTDPNDPETLKSKCVGDCLARFLLAVEENVFLGADGWDPVFDLPLGNPAGPAVYTPAQGDKAATLSRNFSSGTYVVFTYDKSGTDGKGIVFWGGSPPPTPSPPPVIKCGDATSTVLADTTFGYDDVTKFTIEDSAQACCSKCAADSQCVFWAWHESENKACHYHGSKSDQKAQEGTTAGVMQRW